MNFADLRTLAASVGFPAGSLDVAAAIAMAESRGDPSAVGDSGNSFGLWQINIPSHPDFRSADLFDPTTNAHAALVISKVGTDFTPWSTYNDGTFRNWMPRTGWVLAIAAGILGLGAAGWYFFQHDRMRD